MAGLEAIGLILNILPVVIEVVDWYSGRIRGRESKQLADSLKNNRQIFLNSIEYLLRSVVSAEKVKILLDKPGGDAWREPSFVDQVNEHLGDEAEGIIEKIGDIHKVLIKLQEKLPSREVAKTDKNVLVRGKHIIKCFVQAPHYKSSLDRLKISVGEFRTLTEDALKLAPQRCIVPKQLRHLDLVQECASDLHDALQAGWQCDCDHFHPANIKLDVWTLNPGKGAEKVPEDVSLKFSFLFAKDARQAHADHWITAEIVPLKGSPKGSPNGGQPSAPDSLSGSAKRSITFQSANSSSQPISLSRSVAVPSTVQDNVDSIENVDQETMADVIQDLCAMLKQPSERPPAMRRRLGSISSPTSDGCYNLFSEPEHLPTVQTRRSVRLSEVLAKHNKLSMKNRVGIAMMLAWGVLQISCTGWLNGKWTKENILLVTDAPNNPLPYVTHRFQSSRRMSQSQSSRRLSNASTLDPEATNHIADWIKNASLFALGVFLLEMVHNRTIEDLATAEEKKAEQHTQFLTAMRLAKGVQDELGLYYSQAVNACLNPSEIDMDSDGNPKDSSQFAKCILKNIIEPLKTCADQFGS